MEGIYSVSYYGVQIYPVCKPTGENIPACSEQPAGGIMVKNTEGAKSDEAAKRIRPGI